MAFLIGFLTLLMVLDCVVLIFLVLIQLPKKEAGAGLAFGGSATDALFGAGSGNVLTKITKYSAGIFFVLAIVLALMQKSYSGRNTSGFMKGASAPAPISMPPSTLPEQRVVPSNAPAVTPSMPSLPTNTVVPKPAAEAPAPAAASTNVAPK